MEFFAAGMLLFIAGALTLCILFLFYSFLLYLSAAWVGIIDRSFGKAMLSTLVSTIVSSVAGFVLGFVPFIGVFISLAASILVPVLFTQIFFHTDLLKAFLAELIRMVIALFLSGIFFLTVLALFGLDALMNWISQCPTPF